MTGPEHYVRAEALLELASQHDLDVDNPYAHEQYLIAKAQVHATLALAAATVVDVIDATTPPFDGADDWRRVVQP